MSLRRGYESSVTEPASKALTGSTRLEGQHLVRTTGVGTAHAVAEGSDRSLCGTPITFVDRQWTGGLDVCAECAWAAEALHL